MMNDKTVATRIEAAIALIESVPGYDAVARDLRHLAATGRIRFDAALIDRAHAGLLGAITLGPEPLAADPLGLAETLVHEHHHLKRQNPFAKTSSFWLGVATGTPVLARYEKPAYDAALRFLEAVAAAFPDLRARAESEHAAVTQNFAAEYEPSRTRAS